MPDFRLEDAVGGRVVGIDEAGRGPWAGPVVAAAVAFEHGCRPAFGDVRIEDSKRLRRRERERAFAAIAACARFGVGLADEGEIDRLNILGATLLAMARAFRALSVTPALALVDGNRAPCLPCPVRCVVGGDGLSVSVAAASIVAKVARDKIMADLAAEFPAYGWERNAGYGTPAHRDALARLGPSPHHRQSFRPVREWALSPAPTAGGCAA